MLHESGLTPTRLRPEDDHTLPALGLGLTDLVSHDVDALAAKAATWRPEWVAFTSKTVAAVVARALGERPPGLGPTTWDFAGAGVFVLPGTSGANRRRDYDGRPGRLPWWRDLAGLVS